MCGQVPRARTARAGPQKLLKLLGSGRSRATLRRQIKTKRNGTSRNIHWIPDRPKKGPNPSEISRGRWPCGLEPPVKRRTPFPEQYSLMLVFFWALTIATQSFTHIERGSVLQHTCSVCDRLAKQKAHRQHARPRAKTQTAVLKVVQSN